jgi:type VI secretion system secreted protein Hcp
MMAEFDYFLKIDGIQGESTSSKHKGEIEIQAWNWGEHLSGAPAAGGGGGAGKVEMDAFHAMARTSMASPILFLKCAQGTHFKEAVLTAVRKKKGKPQTYLTIKLSDVIVTSYQIGAQELSTPVDTFDLEFSKIEVEYSPLKDDGSLGAPVKAGWDVKANAPV